MFNGCLKLVEGLWTHTPCLNWHIEDFKWKFKVNASSQGKADWSGKDDAMNPACRLIACRTRTVPWYVSEGQSRNVCTLSLTFCCVCCVPPRQQTRHGSVCFRGIHNDVTDRKEAGRRAWHLSELAGSPLARQKECNNKQAIRRQRERTQRHRRSLQIITAGFSLQGDDYLCSSVVRK